MIGWHYTSAACWERIKHEGLVPYPLSHPAIISQPCPRQGIWLYRERQRQLSHLGCLIWQLRHKQTAKLVLLKVQFSVSDITFRSSDQEEGRTLSLNHDLSDANMVFHTKTPATIAWQPIPPRRIRLAGYYDLIDLVDPVISTSITIPETLELQLTQ